MIEYGGNSSERRENGAETDVKLAYQYVSAPVFTSDILK